MNKTKENELEWLKCSNCGGINGVNEFDTPTGSTIPEKKINLCEYCSGSSAGNAFFFPIQYPNAAVLRGIAAMMNVLEKRLRR